MKEIILVLKVKQAGDVKDLLAAIEPAITAVVAYPPVKPKMGYFQTKQGEVEFEVRDNIR